MNAFNTQLTYLQPNALLDARSSRKLHKTLIKKKFNLFENNENLNNVLEQRWESNVIEKQKKKVKEKNIAD